VDELAGPKTPGGGAQADGGAVWSASLAREARGGEPNGDPDPATEADPEGEPGTDADPEVEPGTDAEPETAAEPVTGPPGAKEPRCGRVLLR
jgi:hypothetical protein